MSSSVIITVVLLFLNINQPIMNEAQQLQIETQRIQYGKVFTVTAYDLSVQSCGKKITSRAYGITRTGKDLRGLNYKTAKIIAVDPKVIPLHSVVYLKFIDEKYSKYTGVYTAEDTGGAIKGNHVDLFIIDSGEKVSKVAMDFGVTTAFITVIK